MSGTIELYCYLAPAIKKAGTSRQEFLRWHVVASKPFDDIENFGALCQQNGIQTVCELCDYSEGVVRDVIDAKRTPEELGYRPHMAVFVRQKRSSQRGNNADPLLGNLTGEEELVLAKIRNSVRGGLLPEQPCPVCLRVADGSADGNNSSRKLSRKRSSMDATSAGGSDSFHKDNLFRLTCEVGVQCGSANRVGQALMPVAFGSSARFKPVQDGILQGMLADEFPPPSTHGGPKFLSHDGELTELKGERDRYRGERDQLANLLREEQRKVHELQRERHEHRCEGSEKVQQYILEIERLQANMRDLMRGREEVFALLHQRRTAGAGSIGEAPRGYAPFRVGPPVMDAAAPHPKDLLAKATSVIAANRSEYQLQPSQHRDVVASFADEPGGLQSDLAVVKKPSGPGTLFTTLLQPAANQGPPGHLDQHNGQALLRMYSSVGDPYYVKRLVKSLLQRGRNYLVLMSLDGSVTDEIEVDQLTSLQAEGDGMLALNTDTGSWVLYMNAKERQRWVNWVFVLNPWLSTSKQSAGPSSMYLS